MSNAVNFHSKFDRLVKARKVVQPRLSDAQCAGTILSMWANNPNTIMEAAGAALEDVNQHALAWVMFQAAKGALPPALIDAINRHFQKWLKKSDWERDVDMVKWALQADGEAHYGDEHTITPTHNQGYTVTGHDFYRTPEAAMRAINKGEL